MALLKSRKPISIFVGGVGSGKTRGAVYKSLQLGVENAPCFGLFVEPTYAMIRDVAVRSFQEVFDGNGIPYVYSKSDNIIRVADKFDILLRSGDQPERLFGLNAAWAIIDEPASQEEEVPKIVLQRLRDPRARLKQLVLTGTPNGYGWFYEWAHRGDADKTHAKTSDNPYLDPQYIEEMRKRYTDEEIRAYINGEFVRFEGAWYRLVPTVARYRQLPSGLKLFREPNECSSQIVIGADTAGGLGRDRSAVAVIDKKDSALIASWVSASATIDELCDIVCEADSLYTVRHRSAMAPYVPADQPARPYVVVEVDGIGRATWQNLVARPENLILTEIKTKEWTRYAGLLAAKRAVESSTIYGPEELSEEARDLYCEDQKFRGKKDLSMAIGFCLNHMAQYPFEDDARNVDRTVLNMNQYLKPKRRTSR